jgi:hypothetical protein
LISDAHLLRSESVSGCCRVGGFAHVEHV